MPVAAQCACKHLNLGREPCVQTVAFDEAEAEGCGGSRVSSGKAMRRTGRVGTRPEAAGRGFR